MKRQLIAGLVGMLASVMAGRGGNVGQDIISGRVSRAGGSVAGILVAACDVNDLCNQQDPAAAAEAADGKNITPVTPPKSNANFALQAATAGSLEVKPQFLHR